MRVSASRGSLKGYLVGLLALLSIVAAACAPAQQPAQKAAPAQQSPPQAAEPAKPAAQPTKPAAQPAKPAAATDEPDPALVAAAKKEGKITWYTSLELSMAKRIGSMFEKKYGIRVEVVRSGSERIFDQFMKEQETNITKADVVHTSDASHFLTMREKGFIAPYRPKAVDVFLPNLKDRLMDKDDYWFALRISPWVIIYNTNKVKEADAPKSWKELTDPKWKGKLVHAHPGYSGATLTAVYTFEQVYGTDYFKQLAKNEPLIVQSGIDVPAKVIPGEREVGTTLNYNAFPGVQKGQPIKIVYPDEGVPLIFSPQALVKSAPHPNAAKLFIDYSLSREAQQALLDEGGQHSPRSDVKLPQGQVDLAKIKPMFADPAKVEQAREQIQKRFKENFGV